MTGCWPTRHGTSEGRKWPKLGPFFPGDMESVKDCPRGDTNVQRQHQTFAMQVVLFNVDSKRSSHPHQGAVDLTLHQRGNLALSRCRPVHRTTHTAQRFCQASDPVQGPARCKTPGSGKKVECWSTRRARVGLLAGKPHEPPEGPPVARPLTAVDRRGAALSFYLNPQGQSSDCKINFPPSLQKLAFCASTFHWLCKVP